MKWKAALVLLAAALAWLPLPAAGIERLYANGAFPFIQASLTSLSNRVSFALFDALILLVAGTWMVALIRDLVSASKTGWLRTIVRLVMRTVTIVAASYLLFLVCWGLNYRRIPLEEKLSYNTRGISADAAARLAEATVERLNRLHAASHAGEWTPASEIDPVLADAFAQARRELRLPARTVPARPKRSLLDLYFVRAGVAGMTDPYFLETFTASDLLPFERAVVTAHEWAHLAGIADEGEANFLAWLICLRGGASHQYSGWLALYGDVLDRLEPARAREIAATLGSGPRADLIAIRERYERHVNKQVSAAGWRVYDQYLKANDVVEGAASYAQVVRLILGTEFGDGWTPRLR